MRERTLPTTLRTVRSDLVQIAIFYMLAFALSWGTWLILILNPTIDADWPLLYRLGAYGPIAAALIIVRATRGREEFRRWLGRIFQWRRCWFWIFAGWLLLPALVMLLHMAVYVLLGNQVSLAADPPWYWIAGVYPVNVIIAPIVIGSSLGEEPGWQGFALPGLTAYFHPVAANVLHGILWATWHLPAFLTSWAGERQPLVWFFAYIIPLAMIMYWLTRRAGGSVIPAVLFHSATNLYSAHFQSEAIFTGTLSTQFAEIKTVVYWTIAIAILFVTRGRLGHDGLK